MAISWNTSSQTPSTGINWGTSPAPKPDSFHAMATTNVAGVSGIPSGGTPSLSSVAANVSKLPAQISAIAEKSPAAPLGHAIGDSLYNIAATLGQLGHGDLAGAAKTATAGAAETNSQAESGIGSTIESAALPASMLAGGGTGSTVLARIGSSALTYGGLGALTGGANAAANNGSASDVLGGAAEGGLLGAAGGAVGQGLGEGMAAFKAPAPDAEQLSSIQDTISPKLTAKQTAAAFNENRVTRAPDTFMSKIFGQQPDTVAPSQAVQQAAQTIKEAIPGAGDMNDAQLHTALSEQISNTGAALRPQMEATPITQKTTGQIIDAWNAVKSAQQEEPEFDAFAGSAKSQAKFESFLKPLQWDITDATGKFQAPTPKSLADIWDARIGYDSSIPANVKNATEASAPQLQFQKEMWLQNRALLNHAINDTAAGLGQTSQNAFAKMTDMYTAQQNILSKAKINTAGTPGVGIFGKLGGALKGNVGRTAVSAAALYGADKASKSITGIGI